MVVGVRISKKVLWCCLVMSNGRGELFGSNTVMLTEALSSLVNCWRSDHHQAPRPSLSAQAWRRTVGTAAARPAAGSSPLITTIAGVGERRSVGEARSAGKRRSEGASGRAARRGARTFLRVSVRGAPGSSLTSAGAREGGACRRVPGP